MTTKHIVVGVDGSSASRAAARWAVDHARETGADLEAIHAWSTPEMGHDRVALAYATPTQLEREARREIREVVDELDERGLVAPVATRIVCGEPAATLLQASRHADLVVVGRQGLGTNGDPQLGTVSRRLIQDAGCPVVVVPA